MPTDDRVLAENERALRCVTVIEMMDATMTEPSTISTGRGDGARDSQPLSEMAHSLHIKAPQVVVGTAHDEKDGETISLLGTHAVTNPTWLTQLENGQLKDNQRLLPTAGSEWQVVGEVNGLCCGIRKHRMIEVVHLRHANYGLRWGSTTGKTSHKAKRDDDEETGTAPAPFCMVGPHWWLMTATFTVFLLSALVVTVLTVPHAGVGEAATGILLSAACLTMYGKVGCTNPGIVEHLSEPVDDTDTYCDQCESYRPASALHCMDCRVCIEEYDHHCPWTGKCIGKRNVKYFYAWLFFLVLAFVYEMIEFTTYMLPPQDQPSPFDSDDDDSFFVEQNHRVIPTTAVPLPPHQ